MIIWVSPPAPLIKGGSQKSKGGANIYYQYLLSSVFICVHLWFKQPTTNMQSSIVEDPKLALNYHKEVEETAHHGHPDHRMLGVIVFLVAETMIFAGLFGAFLVYRTVMPEWPPEGTPELELLVPGVNTIILVSSSFVMHKGQAAIKNNDVFWFTNLVCYYCFNGSNFPRRTGL